MPLTRRLNDKMYALRRRMSEIGLWSHPQTLLRHIHDAPFCDVFCGSYRESDYDLGFDLGVMFRLDSRGAGRVLMRATASRQVDDFRIYGPAQQVSTGTELYVPSRVLEGAVSMQDNECKALVKRVNSLGESWKGLRLWHALLISLTPDHATRVHDWVYPGLVNSLGWGSMRRISVYHVIMALAGAQSQVGLRRKVPWGSEMASHLLRLPDSVLLGGGPFVPDAFNMRAWN